MGPAREDLQHPPPCCLGLLSPKKSPSFLCSSAAGPAFLALGSGAEDAEGWGGSRGSECPGATLQALLLTGIKQILPHQMTTAGPVLGEGRGSDAFFDALDHVIDVHGHIIGMGLSPDNR